MVGGGASKTSMIWVNLLEVANSRAGVPCNPKPAEVPHAQPVLCSLATRCTDQCGVRMDVEGSGDVVVERRRLWGSGSNWRNRRRVHGG